LASPFSYVELEFSGLILLINSLQAAPAVVTSVEDNDFTVQDALSVDGKTAAETAAILTGFTGETKPGRLANWLFDSVNCAQ